MESSCALLLFRLDLRIQDNPALNAALQSGLPVIPLFIADPERTWFPDANSNSYWWLFSSLKKLQESLQSKGSNLILRQGNTLKSLGSFSNIKALYYNRTFHPGEDEHLEKWCNAQQIEHCPFNGSLLVQPWEVTTKTGGYFKVFTPFWKTCLKDLTVPLPVKAPKQLPKCPSAIKSEAFPEATPKLDHYWKPGEEGAHCNLARFLKDHIADYAEERDYPYLDSTSLLSPYLHFGEISIREVFHKLLQHPEREKYLSELGWREFSYHLLYHYPKLPTMAFDKRFNAFPWKKNSRLLETWQSGKTGYPIVDAGMRQLAATGWMHNRVRMVVASFLTKHLLQPWQEGADWFLQKLVDADLANNSASWQWVAGCGADAAPYYRIFNPIVQGEKFDPEGSYVKKWVPEIAHIPTKYIHKPWEIEPLLFKPVVDHQQARNAALAAFEQLRTP